MRGAGGGHGGACGDEGAVARFGEEAQPGFGEAGRERDFHYDLPKTDGGERGYAVAIFKPGNDAHYTLTDTPYSKIYVFDFKP